MQQVRYGFIGLGAIGLPIAHRIRSAGFDLVVYDVRQDVAQEFAQGGGQCAASPREVANLAHTIFYSLPTPNIVNDVTLGSDGIIHGTAVRRIVDFSTTGPRVIQQIAKSLEASNISLFDAPVSGGIRGAAEGKLTLMCAGSADSYDDLRKVFEAMGKSFYVGSTPGMGQTVKVLNNMLSAASMAITTEVMVVGVKEGLDAGVMIDIFNASSGRSGATEDKYPKSVLTRTFKHGFRTDLLLKDIKLGQEIASENAIEMTVGKAVVELWTRAAQEYKQEDFTNVVKLLEQEAGVVVARG